MAEEPRGFLSRWARRKTDVLQGKATEEPSNLPDAVVVGSPSQALPEAPHATIQTSASTPMRSPVGDDEHALALKQSDAAPPALSLDDVRQLTQDSDFKPFMARNVDAGVRNAAMKKLFSNPQFNVMDGLDTYIDDYSIADPIPESMLRSMAGAKFLNLFAEEHLEDSQAAPSTARENAGDASAQTVAQSTAVSDDAEPARLGASDSEISSQPEPGTDARDSAASQHEHAHTDLRLQPHHAASSPEAGGGPE